MSGAGSADWKTPTEITRPILERYQRWLYHYRKTNGQPLGVRTQHTRLQPTSVAAGSMMTLGLNWAR